ncbi:MAG: Calx-beta domain-containing protein, partial [Cyanobacteria bacterium P01_A01_bin.135]
MVDIQLPGNILLRLSNYASESFDVDNNPLTDDEVDVIKVTGNVVSGGSGSATLIFDEPSGLYDISGEYFDQPNGNGRLELRVNGVSVGTIELDRATGSTSERLTDVFATDVALQTGDSITLIGTRDNNEYARVISLNFDASDTGEVFFGGSTFEVNEADGTATINLIRSSGAGTAEVNVRVGRPVDTATAGSDYVYDTTTRITFAPGVTTQSFTIPIIDDALAEGSETVTLSLTSGNDTTTVGASARLTILDDETPT